MCPFYMIEKPLIYYHIRDDLYITTAPKRSGHAEHALNSGCRETGSHGDGTFAGGALLCTRREHVRSARDLRLRRGEKQSLLSL